MSRLVLCYIRLLYVTGNKCEAQARPKDEYALVADRMDSLLRAEHRKTSAPGLVLQIDKAFKALNRRPNTALDTMDKLAKRSRTSTSENVKVAVVQYLWHGMADSLGLRREIEANEPALKAYSDFVCPCLGRPQDYGVPMSATRKFLSRYDSCRNAYQKPSAPVKGPGNDAGFAYLQETCHVLRMATSAGLPVFSGNSPQEVQLVAFNEFIRTIVAMVMQDDWTKMSLHASAADLKTLSGILAGLKARYGGKEPILRMLFYNDEARFIFIANGPRIDRQLSFGFSWNGSRYHISKPVEKEAAALSDLNGREAEAMRHYFRYPVILLNVYACR